jgi:aminoglycoside phosphotransferase family enzyme
MQAVKSGVRDPRPAASMDEVTAAKVAFLSDPASYPGHPAQVDRRETHFAWVFLAGERAYKMKKPSHLRGADWRSTEARELACREELRLNRRLSAPTYLGVEPLIGTPAGFRIGGGGHAVDWLVVMRRLDERRMLDAVLADGRLSAGDLDAVLAFLVDFYKSRDPLPFTGDAYLRRVRSRIDEALTALQRPGLGLPGERIAPLARELTGACESLRPELAERATGQRIAEVHGDLRAEHVWLGPPVQVIDALEVYADLRMLDTAEEIAMLALDCDRPTSSWAPEYLRDHYRQLARDPCSDRLFEFYMALRAATHAKLAIWHLDDPRQFPDPAPWRARALKAVASALRHCRAAAAESLTRSA